MRKFFIIVLVILPFCLYSQRFSGGFLAGVSASQIDGDSYAGFDKVGMQGGIFVNTRFSEKFGAQMEIKYTGKGARKKTTEEDPSVYRLTLHYIDIPVMITYTAKEKFVFEAGLVPGYMFNSSGEGSPDGFSTSYQLEKINKFDISWLIGFRYNINEKLSAGMRYSYSLISIRDYTNDFSNYSSIGNLFGYTTGDYNNYLTFGVYYQFY